MSNTIMPWSVKGVTDEARAIAKAKAQESGLTIGAWLSELIAAAEPETQQNMLAALAQKVEENSHKNGQPQIKQATNAAMAATYQELPYLVLALAKRVAALENDTVEFAASFQDQLSDLRNKVSTMQQHNKQHQDA